MSVINLSTCTRGNANLVVLAASGGIYEIDCAGKFGKIEVALSFSTATTPPVIYAIGILEGATTEYAGLSSNPSFVNVGWSKNTANKINLYWDAVNSKFGIQNNLAVEVKACIYGFLADR
jgi:pyruvate dehydrogenase complex dehydrogenase (E1) component